MYSRSDRREPPEGTTCWMRNKRDIRRITHFEDARSSYPRFVCERFTEEANKSKIRKQMEGKIVIASNRLMCRFLDSIHWNQRLLFLYSNIESRNSSTRITVHFWSDSTWPAPSFYINLHSSTRRNDRGKTRRKAAQCQGYEIESRSPFSLLCKCISHTVRTLRNHVRNKKQ